MGALSMVVACAQSPPAPAPTPTWRDAPIVSDRAQATQRQPMKVPNEVSRRLDEIDAQVRELRQVYLRNER